MSTPDSRENVSAFVFANAIGVALASAFLELVLPLALQRVASPLVEAPLDRTGLVVGLVFRFPLMVVATSILLVPFSGSPKGSVSRVLAAVAMMLVVAFDAVSYRWLATQGMLLALGTTPMPLRAVTSAPVPVALAASAGIAVALLVGRALEEPLSRRFAKKGVLAADGITWALGAVLGIAGVVAGPIGIRVGVTPPLVALLARPIVPPATAPEPDGDEAEEPEPADGIPIPPADVREILYSYMAVQDPEPLADRSRPFCRAESEPRGPAAAPRSVTLLVLRGVGRDAISGASPAMPTLAALATSEVSFERVVAGTDDPTQGLVQILAGVAPLAPTRYHELGIVPRLPSLPRALHRLGVESHFVTSMDLSPGRERTLVSGLGFDSVVEPSFAAEAASGRVSGNDDATLEALLAKLAATRGRPRFVTATLGSIDALRDAATPPQPADAGVPTPPSDGGMPLVAPASMADRRTVLAELDARLARFLSSFRELEAPRGAVLVVVSDSVHTSPTGVDGSVRLADPRFDVPLVLVGLTDAEKRRARGRTTSLAGLLDVAQTILGLEGQGPVGCFQGRDLLAARDTVPSGRRLVSFAGADQQFAYVFDGRFRWQIDRTDMQGAFGVFDMRTDPGLTHDLYDANDEAVGSNRDYVLSVLGVGRYLAGNDRFVLGEAQIPVVPLPNVEVPESIGPASGATRAALVASVSALRAAGFTAILVPVTLTADLEPQIGGEAFGTAFPLLARAAGTDVRLALDVALPDLTSPTRSVDAARRLAKALDTIATAVRTPITLFPRDPIMAMSLAARTERTVYVRVPGQSPDFVEVAHGFGVDGIVFDSRETPGMAVERARQEGMRVVVNGVDSLDATRPAAQRPDFVIVTGDRPLRH